MPVKRTSLLFVLLSLLITSLHAQSNPFGHPWIQNYHFSETGGSEQNWCITQDFRGVIYVGNNNNGILEYDGSDWRTLPVPGEAPVRSLASGEDGFVYAGLDGDFGRLEPDEQGDLHFRSLADPNMNSLLSDDEIWKTYAQDGKVYFCATDAIFVYDPATGNVSVIETPEFGFMPIFIGQQLYIGDYVKGLMKYAKDSFELVPGGGFFKGKNISGLVPFDTARVLVATFTKGLFLLNLEKGSVDSTFIGPMLKEQLIANTVFNLKIQGNNIYLGTFTGGLYILDRQGTLKEMISERDGLIDNTVVDVHIPPTGQGSESIWIAHWKGVSKVDINNPFRSVTVGQGRMGMGMGGMNTGELFTDITEFRGQFFISTMGGLLSRSNNPERPGFRPLRGIRGGIFDLQVVEPEPGIEFLLASGQSRTYVIDQNLGISTLEVGGQKLITDPDKPKVFYTGRDHFKGFEYRNGLWKIFLEVKLDREPEQMVLDRYGFIWTSRRSDLMRLELSETGEAQIRSFDEETGLPEGDQIRLFTDPESRDLLVGTNSGFYHYDYLGDSFFYDSLYNGLLPEGKNEIMTFHRGAKEIYWFSFENEYLGWSILGARRNRNSFEVIYDRPFQILSRGVPTEAFYTDKDHQLWFLKSNQLFHFDESLSMEESEDFKVLMRNVRISGDSILFHGTNYSRDPAGRLRPLAEQSEAAQPDLKYLYRDIEFQWSSPYFMQERRIRYSYFLKGFSTEWRDWERSRSIKFTNLPHGRYEMQVKALNVFGDESPPASYVFTILRPWYATFLAISLYIILIVSLGLFVFLYTRKLRLKAELLERQNNKIELQNKELENLNEEITSQRDEIESQRDSITVQNELIGQQKNALTDSILYARRIQEAVLPAKEVMRFLLPKHFVFYRPRDIVSGDFFWVDKKDETVWLAVADCTGHGVPGAFMSMLGISLLNEIFGKYSGQPANEIMDELRDQVITSLGQTGDKYEARDGMEMGLVAINTQTREVQFTGAMHNLYTFQKGELVVTRGDRMPVGIHSEGSTLFSAQNLKLDRGDTLYLFSDGYADQFGGEKRKKYGSSRLKKLLTRIQQNILHDQKEVLEKEFDQWKGEEEQIDDVIMIGIKL